MTTANRRPAVDGLYEYDDHGRPVLLVSRCKNCGERAFPTRTSCSECLSTDWEQVHYGPFGKLYAYTMVHETFGRGSLEPPYGVAKVEFADTFRLQGLLDPAVQQWQLDAEVELTEIELERDGDTTLMTYAFRPRSANHA